MVFYYLLLLITRFHSDPRLGAPLFHAGVVLVTPVKIVGLSAICAALLLRHPSDAAPRLGNPLTYLFLMFAILPIVTTLAFDSVVAADPVSSLLSLGLMLMATRLLIVSRSRLAKAIRAIVVASAIASMWLFKQHFLLHMGRAEGMEGDANYEALTLVMDVPMALWVARHDTQKLWRRVGFSCALLMSAGILLTESRAGLLAAAVVGCVSILQSKRKLSTGAVVAVVLVLVSLLAPKGTEQRFRHIKLTGTADNGDEESSRMHFELVRAGLRMIADHPIVGVGLGQFKVNAPDYNPVILQIASHSYIAHDTYVQVAAECGLPVLILFFALVITAFMNLRSVKQRSDRSLADLASAMQLGLIGFCVAGASVTAEFVTTFWLVIFFSQNIREISAFVAAQKAPRQLGGKDNVRLVPAVLRRTRSTRTAAAARV